MLEVLILASLARSAYEVLSVNYQYGLLSFDKATRSTAALRHSAPTVANNYFDKRLASPPSPY